MSIFDDIWSWLASGGDSAPAPVSAGPLLESEPASRPTDTASPLLAGLGGPDMWDRVSPVLQALSMSLLTHTDRRAPFANLPQFLQQAQSEARDAAQQKIGASLGQRLGSMPTSPWADGASATGDPASAAKPAFGGGGVMSPASNKTMPTEAGGPSGNASFASLPMSESSLDKVIRTVYGEAAGEGKIGQQAVAAVIANRSKQAGMDPADVVLAKNQFEPWGNPAARARILSLRPDSEKYQSIKAAIMPVLAGEAPDPTNGATHFYAPKAQAALGRPAPKWDNGSGVDLGNHRFFSLGYGGGGAMASNVGRRLLSRLNARPRPGKQPRPRMTSSRLSSSERGARQARLTSACPRRAHCSRVILVSLLQRSLAR